MRYIIYAVPMYTCAQPAKDWDRSTNAHEMYDIGRVVIHVNHNRTLVEHM